MNIATRNTIIWVSANVIGISAFLFVAAQTWLEPALRDIPGASAGSPIVWVLGALPIALVFVVLHIGAGVRAYRKRSDINRLPSKYLWVTFISWIVILAIDHVHH